MNKRKQQIEMKVIRPESSADIENLVEILQTRESSILVDMRHCKKMKSATINSIIDFISNNQKSYMTIRVKKMFQKVFICWSEHSTMYI